MDISGKTAIVTGSGTVTGIGAMTARALAAKGCNVVVNFLNNEETARETATLCESEGVDVLVCQGDVSKDDDCRRLVGETMDRWGRLDVLVNNAATTKPIPQPDLDALDAAEFQRIFGVNLTGPYQMSRAAAPHLKASGDAAIVNISSVGGWRAGGSSMAYCASKGALNTLTISLARVLAPEIRVNALCPGGLLGNWTRKILSEEGYQRRVMEAETRYPLHRPVMPEDVAAAALWLIEGAHCMTGELIRIDSGQHLL